MATPLGSQRGLWPCMRHSPRPRAQSSPWPRCLAAGCHLCMMQLLALAQREDTFVEPAMRAVQPMSSIKRWVGGEGGRRTPKCLLSPFQRLSAAADGPMEICCTRLLYHQPFVSDAVPNTARGLPARTCGNTLRGRRFRDIGPCPFRAHLPVDPARRTPLSTSMRPSQVAFTG
jgi:hypothetical protein